MFEGNKITLCLKLKRTFKHIFYRSMKWSESHDILFAREVLVSSLYETRNGSPERGKVWDEIAGNLNK